MPAALPVVRSLFALASEGATGIFRIERVSPGSGSTSRIELEQGFVHAMSNVGEAPRGEDTLLALLSRLSDEAQPGFEARNPRSPLIGYPVAAFNPARALRRHVDSHAPRSTIAPSDDARLELRFRPHKSCLDGLEGQVVALLSIKPRRFGELGGALPRPLLERLVGFLELAGALAIEDPETAAAWTALGLASGAAPEEIKRAWRQLARELHPDLHGGAPDAERLTERFHAANAAYKRLLPGG